MGSAYLAAIGDEPQCESLPRAERRQRNCPGDPYAESIRAESIVPVGLALLVAIASALQPNPVFPLPLSWAIWWMGPRGERGEPSRYPEIYWAAILLLWASAAMPCGDCRDESGKLSPNPTDPRDFFQGGLG